MDLVRSLKLHVSAELTVFHLVMVSRQRNPRPASDIHIQSFIGQIARIRRQNLSGLRTQLYPQPDIQPGLVGVGAQIPVRLHLDGHVVLVAEHNRRDAV